MKGPPDTSLSYGDNNCFVFTYCSDWKEIKYIAKEKSSKQIEKICIFMKTNTDSQEQKYTKKLSSKQAAEEVGSSAKTP